MSSLPNGQQKNRLKTVPFVNNHNTRRGAHWGSGPGSDQQDDRFGEGRVGGLCWP